MHDHHHLHPHAMDHGTGSEATPPTRPSQAVLLDVGEHAGALVLLSCPQREGLEVEIHPVVSPEQRQHVWVLPRQGRDGATIHAAVFPCLTPDVYSVLEPDGSIRDVVAVPANRVTYSAWDEHRVAVAPTHVGT